MSVIGAAWRTLFWADRPRGAARRMVRRRWRLRLIGGALTAGTCWVVYGGILAFYDRGALTVAVKCDDLVVSVCCDGAVESADNLAIKNLVPGWRNILQIVPDGSCVRKGDPLLRLDSTSLEEAITAERRALAKAEAATRRTKQTWEAARIAVDEYDKGIYVRRRLDLSRHILEAERRLASVEHSLLQIQIMFRRGFVSPPHVEAMEAAVEKEQSNLAAANLKRDVLDNLTRVKVLAELSSTRDAAAARWEAEQAVLRTKSANIARLVQDVNRCTMRAPRDGMVIYAGDIAAAHRQTLRAEWDALEPAAQHQVAVDQGAVYQGAAVRHSQTLVHLADLGQLQVKALVAHGKLSELRRGQRACVTVLDRELRGSLVSIADRPEKATLRGDNLKQYAVVIALDGGGERLKPGMTAEVEILIDHHTDALVVPMLCVVDEQGKSVVRVKKRGGVAMREVKLGLANDALVEVLEGLSEGEQVLLNPYR